MSTEIDKNGVPAEAELVVEFVNTRDLEQDSDAVAAPAALAAWAAAKLGGEEDGGPDPAAHRRLLALREALRALLRANNGAAADEEALAVLAAAAARSDYRAALSGDRLGIEPTAAGLDGLEARLLLAVARLQSAGQWPRLKACPAGDCEWAFYDTSRNRSRTWCSMEECGNRAKTKRYRSRRR